jgi:N6-adenosine-specific RNA methylase IME4
VTTLPIAAITVGNRHRKDMGDIDALAKSIAEIGLLHPVVVNDDGLLIAGQRRLEACRRLGLVDIPVTVMHLDDILRGENDENTQRKDFTPSEAVDIWQAMESRQGEHSNFGESFPEVQRRERAASATGYSTKTLSKAKAVVDAADERPGSFSDLVQTMDDTGKVDRAYTELKRRRQLDENRMLVQQAPAVIESTNGHRYSTVVLDPPWDWGDEGDVNQFGRATPTYATMPIAEIAALPVGDLAQDNAHLYLWITNRSLPKGFGLLDAWGFRYVTMLTWVKPSFGMGNYFRGSTEHVLFGVRGSLPLLLHDVPTHFAAPRPGEHSGKPDHFFALVESCSPGPWLEMFARTQRPGWTAWGAEAWR